MTKLRSSAWSEIGRKSQVDRQRGSALMPTDWDALAYQGAALNETARVVEIFVFRVRATRLRDGFGRLITLPVLTHDPLSFPGFIPGVFNVVFAAAHVPISHPCGDLV